MEEYNTVIIGCGISGMTAAIYLERAGIKPLIIEKEMPGGQLTKACNIENYPGYDSISGSDLAIKIYKQLNNYNPNYLYEEVKNIDKKAKTITTTGKKIRYKYLIIATGRRNRLLNLEDEKKYISHGISFCASCDGNLYKNEEVAVIGGANSAISEAIYLSKICKKVYIIYRKDELRGEEILKSRLENTNNIEVIYNQNVTKYLNNGQKITGLELENSKKINVSCIFLAIGYVPNSDLIDVLKDNNYIIVNNKYQTSDKNIYACGDVIKKDLYQLITSAAEGASVANNIIKIS